MELCNGCSGVSCRLLTMKLRRLNVTPVPDSLWMIENSKSNERSWICSKISREMKGLYLSTLLRSRQCGYRRLWIVRCTLSMQWIFWQTHNKRENWVISTKVSKKTICWLLCPKLCISACVKLSQRSSKYSEFSHVSPTCDSSIISSDANLKNNETSYNEEVISENT